MLQFCIKFEFFFTKELLHFVVDTNCDDASWYLADGLRLHDCVRVLTVLYSYLLCVGWGMVAFKQRLRTITFLVYSLYVINTAYGVCVVV